MEFEPEYRWGFKINEEGSETSTSSKYDTAAQLVEERGETEIWQIPHPSRLCRR